MKKPFAYLMIKGHIPSVEQIARDVNNYNNTNYNIKELIFIEGEIFEGGKKWKIYLSNGE